MSAPTLVSKSDQTIAIEWTALVDPATGNSAIVSYNLYWDEATTTVDIELTDTLTTTFDVNGLTGGETYLFKVRAYNIYGYGDFSAELSVKASDVPGNLNIPTVTLDGIDVKITWEAPDNHDETIDAYEVLFKKADGTYVEDTVNCDASSDPVFSALTCSIPMIEIPTLTSRTVDTVIQAKVRAQNVNGWSAYSEPNSIGQVVHTIPLTMDPVTYVYAEITNTQTQFHWTALTGANAGGSAVGIDNYEIEWDQGDGGSWVSLITLPSTDLTYTHLTRLGGTSYGYRIRAINEYGDALAFSDPVYIWTAQAPETPDLPTVTIESVYVKIAWVEPVTNNRDITAY